MSRKNFNKTDLKAWALLVILSLVWGSSFILIKKGLITFSPGEVGAIRILSAGIFLSPIAIINLAKIRRAKQWLILLSVGLVGSLIPAFLFAEAQTELSSSITGVLNALTPLFTLIIGALFFRKPVTSRNAIGLLVAFAGTGVLIAASAENGITDINYYVFYVILATVCYGLNLNFIKVFLHDVKAVNITGISLLIVLPFLVWYLFFDSSFLLKLDHNEAYLSLIYLLMLGVGGTAIALVLFNYLVHIKDPVFASSVTYIIPIVAIIWGVIDGEVLVITDYLGIMIIIAGVYIANSTKKKKS